MVSINGHRGLYARSSIRCKTRNEVFVAKQATPAFLHRLKFNSHLSRELILFQISSAFSPFVESDVVVIINSYTFNVLSG